MPKAEILHTHLPTVAIVGRPNVGKSTLFNRIVGRRKAVVLDTPGITRDRNFEKTEWNGRQFMLVDTGGYETEPRDITFEQMRRQSLQAVKDAEVVILVCDVKEPDHPVDLDVANILRRSNKAALLAVNKCDNNTRHHEALGFYSMGFENLFSLSALNGGGVADLLDHVTGLLPEPDPDAERQVENQGIRIAVVGRPNVGKSSLINSLLGQERVIATPLPGTTRDTIDTTFRLDGKTYTIIDTAGLRRRGKIERGVEKLSTFSAHASINRCDVALVLIDASEGLTDQDQHVAGYIHEAHRGCILVVNKWDLVEKDTYTAGGVVKDLRDDMGYLNYAPVVMTSALTGQRVRKILSMVQKVYTECSREIDTRTLNKWLEKTTHRLSPPWHKGKQLRIKYMTQTGVRPPSFAFFVNNPALIHFSYERYLANRLREAFGFQGVPLRLKFRRKSRKDRFAEAGGSAE